MKEYFDVIEYGDFGAIVQEEVIGTKGRCVITRVCENDFAVAMELKEEPFYLELRFSNRKNARKYCSKHIGEILSGVNRCQK